MWNGTNVIQFLMLSGIFLSVSLGQNMAWAEVKQSKQVSHYPVLIEQGQTLQTALKASTPIRKNNRHWYGETQWNINPLYRFRRLSGGCYVNERRVELSLLISLPELGNASLLNDDIKQEFKSFYDALYQHEEGHIKLGVEAANEVEAFLSQPNIFSDCQVLQINVNDQITAIIDKYRQLNVQYDVNTQHGKTQGAVVIGKP